MYFVVSATLCSHARLYETESFTGALPNVTPIVIFPELLTSIIMVSLGASSLPPLASDKSSSVRVCLGISASSQPHWSNAGGTFAYFRRFAPADQPHPEAGRSDPARC